MQTDVSANVVSVFVPRYVPDLSANALVLDDFLSQATADDYFVHPQFIKVLAPWVSTLPDLTVPDLADSIEAMLARRASGLPSPAPAMMTMRDYPTDPATRVSALEMLKQIQADGKEELKTLNAEYVTAKAAKAEAKAKAEAERKAFEEFKAKQG